ncbi:MAG TPA: hypothetical protein P5136_02715 [Methanofastidiosum sp.]|nr:hypothetical protein [Methanofastidiosum sp.]
MSDRSAAKSPEKWVKDLKSKGAPKKVTDMIKGIEQSGKKYKKPKEYIMRTIIDKIPGKYLDKPTGQHGPGKSGPLSVKKKKSAIFFEKGSDEFKALEEVLIKIASDSSIENVEEIHIDLYSDHGLVKFKRGE